MSDSRAQNLWLLGPLIGQRGPARAPMQVIAEA